ncbi:glycosyltransferase family 8 protein [Russula brevipes]|nr:glycosyltransferase family 8 protein [Russula brevipes]
MSRKAAYVTLLTKDSYLPGALTLEHSLNTAATHQGCLTRRNIQFRETQPLQPEGGSVVAEYDERFADTWSKLRVFELVEYDRVVMMDSDMIVMRNMDELMELDLPTDWIAAAHDPANCAYTPLVHPSGHSQPLPIQPFSPRPHTLLNSGLVVLTPSTTLARSIVDFLRTSPLVPAFSFPDQDLLAEFFQGKWKPLPWVYNALKTLRAIHKNLWRDEEARVREGDVVDDLKEMDKWWWERFDKLVGELEDDPETRELLLAHVAN